MKRPQVILSIHDVAPTWRDEIEHALSLVRDCCDTSPALLVVPDFHGQDPISEDDALVSLIRTWHSRGSELFLHGYRHLDDGPSPTGLSRRLRARLLTAQEGEFLNLGPEETVSRLTAGIEALRILNAPLKGFVAPAWLYNRHLRDALKSISLPLFEGHLNVYHLPSDRRFFLPAVSFCARDMLRAEGSVRYARMLSRATALPGIGRFRLALHPVDFRHPKLVAEVKTLLKRISENGEWLQYKDLLADAAVDQ